MSFGQTIALGALAGFTIYIGLPLARLRLLSDRWRVALAMFAVGVLAFLFIDVMGHGIGILQDAVKGFSKGQESLGHTVVLALVLGGGFATGTAGLALLERRARPKGPVSPPMAGGDPSAAVAAAEVDSLAVQADAARKRALQTGLAIAAAIGLHNFAEGLAIGVSAKAGEISLATVLIVGFALHNATEGFGIIGPLGDVRPSWRWLGLAGLIGGGPTFIGTWIGFLASSPYFSVAFLAVAAGAILYVLNELFNLGRKLNSPPAFAWGLLFGFLTAYATDLVLTLAST